MSIDWVDVKRILGVLTRGEQDHEIEVKTEGPDEELTADELELRIKTDFSEAQQLTQDALDLDTAARVRELAQSHPNCS